MNLPDDIRCYEPSFLLNLLDGLEGIDGSLYRAWSLEHNATAEKTGQSDEQPILSYLTYSQNSMLWLNMCNTLELLRVMLARYMGDKKTEPVLILPPGSRPDRKSKRTHESLDLSHATAETMFAFLMKTV